MSIIEEMNTTLGSLASNPSTRLPVCICVDASYSMRFQGRMNQVNAGIRSFINEINGNLYAVDSVELAIISFGASVELVTDFCLTKELKYHDIEANGQTPLGQAANVAISAVETRIQLYRDHGITTYKPWLIIISDGKATDSIDEAARRALQLQKDNRVKMLCIGVGDEANDLARFKLDGEVIQLKDFALADFFSWLSKSMSKQSKQMPEVDIDIPGQSELLDLGR